MKQPLRLAELVATLSIATDLGTGHPMERSLRACLLALELGRALGCDTELLADCFYVALLRYAGCAADARHRAALFGDELALGPEIDMVELWQVAPMLAFLHRHGFDRLPPAELETLLATGVQRSVEAAIGTCEVGQSLAARLGLGPGVARALGDIFERWDGRGVPGRASGDGIPLATRIVTVALDVELFYRMGGMDAVQTLLRERSGGQYDPAIVAILQERPALCTVLDAASPWDAVLSAEPGSRPQMSDDAIDEALRAVADFIDLRLPMMSGHSTAVAALSVQAGARLGLSDAELSALRRAAYLHDLGTASVSVSVWEKAGPLSADEWERVRLHPYYTERVLMRATALEPLGRMAALHHERLDGTGYHRQCVAPQLGVSARVLAAAEAYCGMRAPRAHRASLSLEQAASEMRAAARAGQLDGLAAEAILAAAGHQAQARPPARPAGLSRREAEVLALLARGLTNRAIADQLVIAPATVDHHIRHIYTKIGCSTRIAATLFAMEHQIIGEAEQR